MGIGINKYRTVIDMDYLKEKKILLVDDEPEIIKMVTSILNDDGFVNIVAAKSYEEAIQVFETTQPDIAVLDVMLPDGDGFQLAGKIREKSDMPIIFLTAKGEAEDKFDGLRLGADDYIVKPFFPQELVLRIHAILKRCYKEENPVLQLSGCTVDFSKAEVIKENDIYPLTAKEHNILETLYRNAGRIVTIDALCEAAWGDNPFGYENSLMAHIRRIREKIEPNPSKPVSLLTVKGLGYKLVVPNKR